MCWWLLTLDIWFCINILIVSLGLTRLIYKIYGFEIDVILNLVLVAPIVLMDLDLMISKVLTACV